MPRRRSGQVVQRMVECVRHESFYTSRMLVDEPLGLYVGWAVQEGSFCARMPVHNETKDVSLIFSGQELCGSSVRGGLKLVAWPSAREA